jgi:catechol 2,3-dioxygenase-like lactoylglutathione lyase family enzyme
LITRFDHAVIAVSDLGRAVETYRSSLGFDVEPGGRHEHRGTHNAIVRFGFDYLELLGIYDPAETQRSGFNSRALVEFLGDREGGLLGYALATDDITSDAERLRKAGLEVVGPFEMQREKPDGHVLSWRLLVPVDVPWRRRWPFLIEWDDPDEERLSAEKIGTHPNGAKSISGISVVVRNLEEAVELYSILFGTEPVRRDEIPEFTADRASFNLRDFAIDLLYPTGDGLVREAFERDGEGPFEVRVEVANLDATGEFLSRAGIERGRDARSRALLVPGDFALGARLTLTGSS